jgi:hypothetical protein
MAFSSQLYPCLYFLKAATARREARRSREASSHFTVGSLPAIFQAAAYCRRFVLNRDFPFGFMFMVSGVVFCDFLPGHRQRKPIPVHNAGFSETAHGPEAIFCSRNAFFPG